MTVREKPGDTNRFHDGSFPGDGFLQLLNAKRQLSRAADFTESFMPQPHPRSHVVLTALRSQKVRL